MKKIFQNIIIIILLGLFVPLSTKRWKWSYIFVVLAVMVLIARIIWVAVKG